MKDVCFHLRSLQPRARPPGLGSPQNQNRYYIASYAEVPKRHRAGRSPRRAHTGHMCTEIVSDHAQKVRAPKVFYISMWLSQPS